MSAGPFESGRYQDNAGNVWEVRVQPETKGLTLGGSSNAYPTDSLTADLPTLPIKTGSRRGFGITMRSVTVELTANGSGVTAEYLEGNKYTIAVFDPGRWSGYSKDQTGTYLGIACKFDRKSPEQVR